ncbi:glutathione S-transferase family protein [Corynebacterium belfantii]|uniref:Glutathione S-transferase family protein n=1 Tax=Corynebacterium belfantii TaxID=2014537 RepID=A0ABS0LFS2_9CORY|nr:glutathione S-transferase family protein [Corynebacterium belfantii]OLN14779.1 glutathione-dependent reductase [Corynebacterium diphtheriae subsp. lausannense]MBG9311126.1 glutathione S-transferase family protein [Corynebacterium belfantii]MBG9347926.1 glutathione S-transferase family protein [Corynebacterium belfantii]MBG9355138.1 glutathione S-transferase family protein [Corynebacterium belfantii]QBZ30448.1 glutathione S-transferase family protein [Corynebacterium diphtheriae subsp. lausa
MSTITIFVDMSTQYEKYTSKENGGEFIRDTQYIDDRIVDSVSTPTPLEDGRTLWPADPGRYRLVAARACPWAHRTVITRRLKGLEDVISLGIVGPTHDWSSWTFDLDPNEVDPVLEIPRLRDAYLKRYPDYPRGITVPAIVDVATGKVVTNDYPSIVPDFNDQWSKYERPDAPDLYPETLREDIDAVTKRVFTEVNNGVYRCGFAGSQEAYDKAYDRLFTALDWLEDRLSRQRYLVGEHITIADIYLYSTLVRFDAVYHGHFKCNRNKITEMTNLWGYLRDLFQTPGFGDTTDFTEIKQHYYITHQDVNPTQIVPKGPQLESFFSAHGREKLDGSPFAEGVSLPGPIAYEERLKNKIDGQ